MATFIIWFYVTTSISLLKRIFFTYFLSQNSILCFLSDQRETFNTASRNFPFYIFKFKVILRPTVSRPVSLGVMHSSGTRDHFFFLFEIFFRQLGVCYIIAPSLTRRRVCNLLLLLFSPAQSRSGLSPAGLKTIFYCPNS
jgi:hypothetical protein